MAHRGFPNIALVRDALGTLVPAIKKGALPPPPLESWTGAVGFPIADGVIAVQTLARKIAAAYSLQVGTVVVTFLENMKEAGRVELGGPGQRDFYIELNSAYRQRPRVMSAILGHEVGHIFLHHHRLHPPPGLPAEIMTDTVAVLYGFGAAMADTFRVTETTSQSGNVITTTRHTEQMGYLTPDEVGYALVRSGFARSGVVIESAAARDAFATGSDFARSELSAPPLRIAPWWRRLAYLARRWWAEFRRATDTLSSAEFYRLQTGKVMFRCVVCCHAIRVPTRAKLTATCPRCKAELPCDT